MIRSLELYPTYNEPGVVWLRQVRGELREERRHHRRPHAYLVGRDALALAALGDGTLRRKLRLAVEVELPHGGPRRIRHGHSS